MKKKPKKLSKRKQLNKKCIELWSKCVRARDMTCRGCNSDYKLSAHHIRSVTHLTTRFMLRNGLCLCWKCHSLQKFNPERFMDLIIEIIGQDEYNALKQISLGEIKVTDADLEDIIESLEYALKDIQQGVYRELPF